MNCPFCKIELSKLGTLESTIQLFCENKLCKISYAYRYVLIKEMNNTLLCSFFLNDLCVYIDYLENYMEVSFYKRSFDPNDSPILFTKSKRIEYTFEPNFSDLNKLENKIKTIMNLQ